MIIQKVSNFSTSENSNNELPEAFSIQKNIPTNKRNKKDWFSEIDQCSSDFQECFNETESNLKSLKTDLSFEQYIRSKKEINIKNLGVTRYIPKDSKIKIKEYFKDKEIDINGIRGFLKQEIVGSSEQVESKIETQYTLLSLNKYKNIILQEVLNKGPFNTPKDLSQAIGEYIKENMKYDGISMLFFSSMIVKGISNGKDEFINNELNGLIELLIKYGIKINLVSDVDYLIKMNKEGQIKNAISTLLINNNKESFSLTTYHMELFTSIFREINEVNKKGSLPKNVIVYMKEIEVFIKNNDLSGFSEYIINTFSNENEFRDFLQTLIFETKGKLLSLGKNKEIYDMLKGMKIGVCRHYSVIAKEIYNEMIKNSYGINFSEKSEMIYVLNEKLQHAYNILINENPDGTITEQYLDITDFISGNKLFKDHREIFNKRGEIWANNTDRENKKV